MNLRRCRNTGILQRTKFYSKNSVVRRHKTMKPVRLGTSDGQEGPKLSHSRLSHLHQTMTLPNVIEIPLVVEAPL